MRIEQEKVQLFMERIGEPVHDKPEVGDREEAARRCEFILEENNEYREAIEAGDLEKIADALGDLLYVVLGAGVHHGIDLQPIFDEIHRSNMTKTVEQTKTVRNIGVCKRCVKGANYEPPRIAALLLQQRLGLEEEGYGHGV